MKRSFTLLLLTVCFLGASAQVTWNFNTATPTGGVAANSTVSALSQGNNNGTTTLLTSSSVSSGYTGASGGNNAGAAAFTGALNSATSTYFEVTITPNSGFLISISNISFGSRSTGTGPQLVSIRSSLDAFATDAGSSAVSNGGTWALITPSITTLIGGVNTPITLRIYGSAGTGAATPGTANWRIDDLSITYVVGVLAVNLSAFNGNLSGTDKATLKWVSSNESNLAKYGIERSTDGKNYSTITSITANGNSGGSYQYIDANISRTVNFYRLKMINNDGTFKYSEIVRINNKTDNAVTLTLYPSPATAKINTEFYAEQVQDASLTIIDATGRAYVQQNIKVQRGNNTITVPIDNLPKGAYTIMIKSANGIDLKNRFIKN